VNLRRTGFAVFRPVGTGKKWLAADLTSFHILPEQQRRFQRLVQRENSNAKPFAQQGIGNALHADTFLSIVQRDTVAVVIVAAFMYQLSRPAVLLVVHDRHLILNMYTSFLTVKNIPSLYISFLEQKLVA